MAVNKYRIKKWFKMLTGKSILHVNQNIGQCFSIHEIKGYYNDLTEKVLRDEKHIQEIDYLPIFQTEKGEYVYFPIAIFQYGLGCYDLYLLTKEEVYLKKFFTCVKWAIENQKENGAFNAFFFIYPDNPYSAMCQGEAVSLFLRAYNIFQDKKYYRSAQKAIDFMLLPLENGGTTRYSEEEVIFMEYTHLPIVLNGWVFALFGLFDWALTCREFKYTDLLERSVRTLEGRLKDFDCGYWTKYDIEKKIASSFYHNLHIAQMQALKQIANSSVFERYEINWRKYQNGFWKRKRAFVKKAMQKVFERG